MGMTRVTGFFFFSLFPNQHPISRDVASTLSSGKKVIESKWAEQTCEEPSLSPFLLITRVPMVSWDMGGPSNLLFQCDFTVPRSRRKFILKQETLFSVSQLLCFFSFYVQVWEVLLQWLLAMVFFFFFLKEMFIVEIGINIETDNFQISIHFEAYVKTHLSCCPSSNPIVVQHVSGGPRLLTLTL